MTGMDRDKAWDDLEKFLDRLQGYADRMSKKEGARPIWYQHGPGYSLVNIRQRVAALRRDEQQVGS